MTLGPMHGIARYTINLVSAMLEVAPQHDYHLIVNGKSTEDTWISGLDVECVSVGAKHVSLSSQVAVPRALKRIEPDVFHAPSFMVPYYTGVPTVITLHDLIHVAFPRDYSLKHRMYYKHYLRRVISKIPKILTVSEFSKNQIKQYFDLPNDQISVIYNAVGSDWTRVEDEDRIKSVFGKFGIESHFILYVGNLKPHKNVRGLLHSFSRSKLPNQLVICIHHDPGLVRLSEELGIRDQVQFIGYTRDEELKVLYSTARLLAVPSFCEGFGLACLEAMACGCPVIASNRSAVPEVVGDGGLLIDPHDADSLGVALRKVATDERVRDELVRCGYERVRHFNWEWSASETLRVYAELCGHSESVETATSCHGEATNEGAYHPSSDPAKIIASSSQE